MTPNVTMVVTQESLGWDGKQELVQNCKRLLKLVNWKSSQKELFKNREHRKPKIECTEKERPERFNL